MGADKHEGSRRDRHKEEDGSRSRSHRTEDRKRGKERREHASGRSERRDEATRQEAMKDDRWEVEGKEAPDLGREKESERSGKSRGRDKGGGDKERRAKDEVDGSRKDTSRHDDGKDEYKSRRDRHRSEDEDAKGERKGDREQDAEHTDLSKQSPHVERSIIAKEERRERRETDVERIKEKDKSRSEIGRETEKDSSAADEGRKEHEIKVDREDVDKHAKSESVRVKAEKQQSERDRDRDTSQRGKGEELSRSERRPDDRTHREHERLESGKRGRVREEDRRDREKRSRSEAEKAASSRRRSRSRSRSRRHRSRSRSRERRSRERERERIKRISPPKVDPKHKRYGGYSSGLGGYSPRRRKGPRSPSRSPSRSPRREKKAKPHAWDLPPPGMDPAAVAAWQQQMAAMQSQQQAQAMTHPLAGLASTNPLAAAAAAAAAATAAVAANPLAAANPLVAATPLAANPLAALLPAGLLTAGTTTASLAAQQSRQARRLYIGNVPPSVSNEELTEFLNAALVSANAVHIPGTRPCSNCTVTHDKGYAFAEFITPEDAAKALALDGIVLHGTTLKIRRPKDYIPMPTDVGFPGLGGSILDLIPVLPDHVPDGPNKIFIGNVHPAITPERLKEVMTAFGQLKAFRYELDKSKRPIRAKAFMEYMEPQQTVKACAGLNGLRFGKTFITVVQTHPNKPASEVDPEADPDYGTPKHALPLMAEPTKVLELSGLVTRDELVAMPEEEYDEMMEDIKIECQRFGTVKSMFMPRPKKEEEEEGAASPPANNGAFLLGPPPPAEAAPVKQEPADTATAEQATATAEQEPAATAADIAVAVEPAVASGEANGEVKTETAEAAPPSEGVGSQLVAVGEGVVKQEGGGKKKKKDPFGTGRVFVEFSREESACKAAHALHGRTYASRAVTVAYFPHRNYERQFKRVLSEEDKKAIVVVQDKF